jgi:hypothetical protein
MTRPRLFDTRRAAYEPLASLRDVQPVEEEVLAGVHVMIERAAAAERAADTTRGAVRRRSPRHRTWLAAGTVAAAIAAAAAVVTSPWSVQTTPPDVVATGTGPLPEGGSGAAVGSCAYEYSLSALDERAFGFDATVTAIDSGGLFGTNQVTFQVHEWFRGGTEPVVTLDMIPPVEPGEPVSDSRQLTSPSYTVGTRLLVSGEIPQEGTSPQDGTVWGCGFTRYYDSMTADAWRTASD